MKCKKCGAELTGDEKFCAQCGEKVEQVTIEQAEVSEKASPLKSNLKIFAIFLSVVFLFIIIIVLTNLSSCNNKPDLAEMVYNGYKVNELYFEVPEDWTSVKTDNGFAFYADDSTFLVDATAFSYFLTDEDVEDYLSDISDENDYTYKNSKIVPLCGQRARNTTYKYYDDAYSEHHVSMFALTNANTVFTLTFDSTGDNQSDIFERTQDEILASIEMGESDFTEPSTEEETTVEPTTTEPPTTESPTEKPTEKPTSNIPVGKVNALESARSYLKYSAFSYQGLIDQLEYEKYTNEEAVYAADNCGADWDEQAVKSAKNYINYSAFSYQGLIEQLEYEQFTSDQAKYGADNCGADWYEQAVKSAAKYLSFSSFSRESLIDQLEYEGFTHDQAVYGVEQNGY